MDSRSALLNAFKPNTAVEHPAGFAGRVRQILDLTDALLTEGACPVIYGDRGLGKTSLALQTARIALGDVELLSSLGEADRALGPDSRFSVFLINCSDATRTAEDVLQRIINGAEGYLSTTDLEQGIPSVTQSKKTLKLRLFESATIKTYERGTDRRYSDLNREDRLNAVIDALQTEGVHRILFIVDELDRVVNTGGLANFLKNASSASVKFVLVGIANTVSGLLEDHESLQRSLHPVRVGTMSVGELDEIIDRAQTFLDHAGMGITFSDEASRALATAAGGYPWFVHVLGQEALRSVSNQQRLEVTVADVETAIGTLSRNRFAQQFSDQYNAAVRDSYQRELVLRLLAKWLGDDIPLSEIYPLAKALGVSNPSVSKKDLMLKRHGAAIVAPPLHEKGVARFRNNMFKRYIDLRESVYEGARAEVDRIWSTRS